MVRPDGSAVLMDFGLAGWDKIEILAGRGSIGTPMYQPPEQADVNGPFGKISPASDVYGLGATLYYLLTARHPFMGRSVKEVREKIKTIPPDPIRKLNSKVHAAVEALCLRCLKKRQSERFQTPKELNAHIAKVLKLLAAEGKGQKAQIRLKRRVAGALRRRSESASGGSKTANKTKKRASSSGRKTKSAMGSVRAPRKSGQGLVEARGRRAMTAKQDNTNTILLVVGMVGVVVVVLGLLMLN